MNQQIVASLIAYAAEHHLDDLEAVPVANEVASCARSNKRYEKARIETWVPDEWVVNLTGDAKLQDVFLLVRVPREAFERWEEKTTKAAP